MAYRVCFKKRFSLRLFYDIRMSDSFGDCKSPVSEPRNYKFRGAELFDICNVELQINRICNPAFVNKLEL